MKVKCTCKHQFNDAEHGQGVRIVTPVDKSRNPETKKIQIVRCTVCGKEHPISVAT